MPRAQQTVNPAGDEARRTPAIGDMRWDGDVWRRWSGRRWSIAAYSVHPERLRDPAPLDEHREVEPVARRRALDLAVEDQVATNGAVVVFDGPSGVVLGYRRPVSHFSHAVLTALTAGLWGVVWVVCAVARRDDRMRLEADRWGNVWAVPVATSR